MKRVLEVTGSYNGVTGHDNHTRSIVRALHKLGVAIQLNDLWLWSSVKLANGFRDPWFDTLQQSLDADAHLYFCMPHQVEPKAGQRTINYTMFEADRIPAEWVERAHRHDLIVVPVNSCRQAWIDSGVEAGKVVVCPLGTDFSRFKPPPLRRGLILGGERRIKGSVFLNIADAIERKNMLGLLRAWLTATKASDDALLLCKTISVGPTAAERIDSLMRSVEISIGKSFREAAQVVVLQRPLLDDELLVLIQSATHYISASRGEGFDLVMVEAAACGLECIAPRHTSYLDYLNDDIAHLIDVSKVEARLPDQDQATQDLFAGANWWQPDQDQLCSTLRAIIDGTAPPKKSAREALSHLSWEQTAQRLSQLIFDG
ncbi:MAG TPA: hypothetical protein V6C81_21895 [Planktothrix sp.]|jgi:glycosyltransferase involved in cell wall biosynthesis